MGVSNEKRCKTNYQGCNLYFTFYNLFESPIFLYFQRIISVREFTIYIYTFEYITIRHYKNVLQSL